MSTDAPTALLSRGRLRRRGGVVAAFGPLLGGADALGRRLGRFLRGGGVGLLVLGLWSAPAPALAAAPDGPAFDLRAPCRAIEPLLPGVVARLAAEPRERRGVARAGDAPPAEGGRNFVLFVDRDRQVRGTNWFNELEIQLTITRLLDEYYARGDDRVQFVIVFTSFFIDQIGAFYLPLANDVRGIGYRNFTGGAGLPDELFDTNGASPLEGILVLNGIPLYRLQPVYLPIIFNQELGHRWGAFVHFDAGAGDGPDSALLGRDRAHWSYFLDSGGSPMEGNAWVDDGGGVFHSETPSDGPFSPLDLYLMGLVPPEEVADFVLLTSPDTRGQTDGFGGPIGPGSPPEFGDPITIDGVPRTIALDDVVRAEGPRVPASDAAPRSFDVGFLFVAEPGDDSTENLAFVADLIDEGKAVWEGATGDRASLSVLSSGEAPVRSGLGEPCTTGETCAFKTPFCTSPEQGTGGLVCTRLCTDDRSCAGGCCLPGLGSEQRYCFSGDACPERPDGGDGGVGFAAQGGGGCAAGSGTTWPEPPRTGAAAAALLATLLLAWRRRRPR